MGGRRQGLGEQSAILNFDAEWVRQSHLIRYSGVPAELQQTLALHVMVLAQKSFITILINNS